MKQLLFVMSFLPSLSIAQEVPYYYEIPNAPENYSGPSVAARVVDGLGFRYYWATEGLNAEDMNFKPSVDARTIYETLVHIHDLSTILLNAVSKQPTDFGVEEDSLGFLELREHTLKLIQSASEQLRKSTEEDLESYQIVFINGEKRVEYPFWNLLNGPISDAIWHVGQVVSFRRSSGNPFNSKASMLNGKVRE